MMRTQFVFIVPVALGLLVLFGSIAGGAGLLLAVPLLILGGLYFTIRGGRPPIERKRDTLYFAIIMTGVLAGEVAAMLFVQDPPGHVEFYWMAAAALLGNFIGAGVARKVDQTYGTEPEQRRRITFLCTGLVCLVVGGASGWILGAVAAERERGFGMTSEQHVNTIHTWIGICAAIGLGVGLVLATIAFALEKSPPTEEPSVNLEENHHDQPH